MGDPDHTTSPVSPPTPDEPDPHDYDRAEDAYLTWLLGPTDPTPGD